jgi:peptidoglycan/xylan/chitin deacetylase (PgdA/CDA1 family)
MGRTDRSLARRLVLCAATCLLAFNLSGACRPTAAVSLDVADNQEFASEGSPEPVLLSASLAGSTAGKDVPILMYHYLSSGAPPTIYHVSTDLFARQMAALSAYGYQAVSLQDFLAYRAGQSAPPGHPVILTFDDGHPSVYNAARPILLAAGMRATLFVTTDFLGATPQERRGWMVWNPEIQQFYDEGFPIEAHSVTHPNLTTLSENQAWQEIWGSRKAIEDHLGRPASIFCYPGGYGAYDAPIRDLVRQAGFLAGVAAWPDGMANTVNSDIWALPRQGISEVNSVELDEEHPGNFFMRKVDPAFMIPLIEVNSVTSRHANGAPGSCFAPGETVTITITATNRGSPADIWVAVALDDDADHGMDYYRVSRKITLVNSVTVTFTYTPAAPDGRRRGRHFATVDFTDDRQVLGFHRTGWQPAFILADSCREVFLPAISR